MSSYLFLGVLALKERNPFQNGSCAPRLSGDTNLLRCSLEAIPFKPEVAAPIENPKLSSSPELT